MSNRIRTFLAAAAGILVVGCSSPSPDTEPSSSSNAATASSPSEYVLPPEVGTYTNVWATDSPIDLQSEPISVIRAAVEGYAVALKVGPYNSYPGYGRFVDEGTETIQGKADISVELPTQLEPAIAVSGTKHYLLFDVVETATTVDARICEVAFGIYQPHPTHPRKPYEPADLRPVTDPRMLSPEGHILATPEMWRVRIERDPQRTQTAPSSTTPMPVTGEKFSEPERYPNREIFEGWTLKQYSYESMQEPPCNDWAVEQYPMALIDGLGLVYPTNPIDKSYLPTLPPYPGWTHDPSM
jgi:hypothetical protein